MNRYTKNERTLLADKFLQLAQIVGKFRIANYQHLSPQMQRRTRVYHRQLLDFSDHFYTASTLVIYADASHVLDKLQESIDEFKNSLKKINKVQTIINTLSAAVALGASILSKQPLAVLASLNAFMDAVDKTKK